jgi:hypothetical protein
MPDVADSSAASASNMAIAGLTQPGAEAPQPIPLPPVGGPFTYPTYFPSGGGGGGGKSKHQSSNSRECNTWSCNDNNPCTLDECIDDVCIHTLDESKTSFGSCEVDGNGCTAGKCVDVDNDIFCFEQNREFLAGEVGCLDDNPCTADSCIVLNPHHHISYDKEGNALAALGECVYEAMEGAPCITDEACKQGICTLTGTGMPADTYDISCVSSINVNGPFGSECTTNYFGICSQGFLQCADGQEVSGMCVPMFRPGDKEDDCFNPNGLDDNCDGFIDECNCPAPAKGAIYRYVSKSGVDSGDCSDPFSPCLTITYAVSKAVANDVISIGAGTFVENGLVIFDPVQLIGEGPANTIIQGGDPVVALKAQSALCGLTITGGFGHAHGGGINSQLETTMVNCVVSGNATQGADGAGISSQGIMSIGDSSISDNHGILGGGLSLTGGSQTLVVNSTIANNSASFGGGIVLENAMASVINSTISGNTATNEGGGILIAGASAVLNLSLSTITNNAAPTGSGVEAKSGASVNVYTSIIANQASGQDCTIGFGGGTITSLGYNIESATSCGFTNTGDQQNTDPQLGPLQNNGGPTQTHDLATNSPAIDAGQTSCTRATDQRGAPRPVDYPGVSPDGTAHCDIGAFELQP